MPSLETEVGLNLFAALGGISASLFAFAGLFGAYLSWRRSRLTQQRAAENLQFVKGYLAQSKVSAAPRRPNVFYGGAPIKDSDGPPATDEKSRDAKPFEAIALANYYNQALTRANMSFWFSLVFASIGFGVLIYAFVSHTSGDALGTVLKLLSGVIMDAVSGLFFVLSNNSQKSMADFFEKLRLDRLNAEARDMISEIENVERRDQLRAQLILKYSGIDRLLTDAAKQGA